MKKVISWMLCAVLLCALTPVFAESATVDVNGSFKISCRVMPGYAMTGNWVDSSLYTATLTPQDPKRPELLLTIAYSELSNGRTLNDYSEEELKTLADASAADLPGAQVFYDQTGLGTKLIIIRVDSGLDPHVEILTVYRGYELSLFAYISDKGAENQPLSEEDMTMIKTFLTDMTIEG